jgi:dCMP deaminase
LTGELATFYNNEKWDRRFLNIAKEVSSWSKDPSSKIGAVIVDNLGRIVGTGFNGFARGVEDTDERYNNRELKYELVLHAEHNAFLQAGERARGATLYVYPGWGRPCMCTGCAKVAIQCGIKRVVGMIRDIDADKLARWKDSLKLAQVICDEAGLITETVKE